MAIAFDTAYTIAGDAEQARRAIEKEDPMVRHRYQAGSLLIRGLRRKAYVLRYYKSVLLPDGKLGRTRKSIVLGLVSEIGNKKQARIIADGILRGVNLGQYCPQSARTLAEFAMHDWSPTVLPTLKYATQQHYRYLLDVHLLPALGDRRLCDISREAIQELPAAKLRSGLSWKTAKHIRGMVGRVLGCAEQWGYISENTALKTKLPRRGDRPKRTILTPEQIHLLLSDLAEPARSVALLLLLTGLRIGELLALRWSNVNLTARLIEVRETVYEGHFTRPKPGAVFVQFPLARKPCPFFQSGEPQEVIPVRWFSQPVPALRLTGAIFFVGTCSQRVSV